jgi:aspartate racemase
VFDRVVARSPLPLVSIVEATRDHALRIGVQRLALFGTRYTMQGHFYQDVFEPASLAIVVPDESEQGYIHEKYMNELVKGVLLPETRERMLAIIETIKQREKVDAVILGGTELPLLLRETVASGIPLLDTTVIHARAIVERALA